MTKYSLWGSLKVSDFSLNKFSEHKWQTWELLKIFKFLLNFVLHNKLYELDNKLNFRVKSAAWPTVKNINFKNELILLSFKQKCFLLFKHNSKQQRSETFWCQKLTLVKKFSMFVKISTWNKVYIFLDWVIESFAKAFNRTCRRKIPFEWNLSSLRYWFLFFSCALSEMSRISRLQSSILLSFL